MAFDVLAHDDKFRYQLLDRMRLDVRYVIRLAAEMKEDGNTEFDYLLENHLWGGKSEHFSTMRKILESFLDDDKPEWYSFDQLNSDKKHLEEIVGVELG
ncbi:hypothetical protein I6N96_12615 [Enterococcus sp. BWM-S5]|uniref:Large polyvalent protein-associated domain-containing protein n=1 Tax=Enterococcus larvae TaxID=2794352 RepID=A0ABS4CKH9_9ENTE|nr:LPD11 domain-containing protein [Enterococcus larvae]MBP1047116.1 hypothetical protein [Enterococcus larvae]